MLLEIICLVFCILTSFLFIYVRSKKTGVTALLLKMLASGTILITAILLSYKYVSEFYSMFITFGMFFGLIGDILLDLKQLYPKDEKKYLYAGFLAFSLGHIMYFLGISSEIPHIDYYWMYTLLLIIPTSIVTYLTLIMCKKMNVDISEDKGVITMYTAVLSYIVIYSIFVLIIYPKLWILALGFVCFAISDVILSTMYFGDKKDSKLTCVINHTLYYIAQILIVFSICFIY